MRRFGEIVCWNGLSAEEQRTLIEVGALPFGYQPEGDEGCPEPATVALEIAGDDAPGPRLYCHLCALDRLLELALRGGPEPGAQIAGEPPLGGSGSGERPTSAAGRRSKPTGRSADDSGAVRTARSPE
jgi:hypothetical protein